MGTRRRARELALQFLYQWDVTGGPEGLEEALEAFFDCLEHPTTARPYALDLIRGTITERDRLDELIARASDRWRVDRMAVVDRNVLRLAVHELLRHPETPAPVILDEAVEIARAFGGEESARFVNGVLDRVKSEARGVAG